jgi:hypothetical protein
MIGYNYLTAGWRHPKLNLECIKRKFVFFAKHKFATNNSTSKDLKHQ